ncbi:gamma-D-glutamyl-L-diamino acid endopeptidase 1 [Tissierella creatinophila DSM 6911]|uniref:Gamma-D-glutamyl-L-diamino acid endopeptidase 1 n=2 Tax=Tissierella creatinophila TaxID=79681 RepID=A0A1U7M8V5_TISCR|nr:gamma-D-glutamyl-L-diamino acid endopeptidase 1 [Tissierella creatinophila DSM 6911]
MRDYYGVGGNCPEVKCPAGSFPYVIKSGDTLYKLAITYETTVEAIIKINPGINPNNLQIGQRICIPGKTPQKCPMGTFAYTIKQGDTIYNLDKKYNTTVEAILMVNPGINPDNLQIGQIICIPGETPQKCPMGTFAYTIKQGDTIYKLAKAYNTTVEAILMVNPGINPDNLQIGQVICIPSEKPAPDCDGTYYVVRPGDTLYSIAHKYGISLAELMAANPGVDPYNLMVGQLICIPEKEDSCICPGGTVHTVVMGETLATILLRYNISVMDLMAGNAGVDLYNLKPGQKLCILPHEERGCPCPMGTESYTIIADDVKPGMPVVMVIAEKVNSTVANIMMINSNLSPGDFIVGKQICVPSMC